MEILRYLLIGAVGSLALQLAAGHLGTAGTLINLLIPLPLAYAAMRGGLLAGGLASLLVLGVLFVTLGLPPAVAYTVQFALPPLILVALLRRGLAWDRAIALATLLVVLVAATGLLAYTTSAGVDVGSVIDTYVQNEIEVALSLADQAEFSAGQKADYQVIVEQMGDFLRGTFSAWAVLITALLLGVQVLILSRLANGHYQILGQPFIGWKAPEFLVWLLILAGFSAVFGAGLFRWIGMNGLVVLLPIYFLQGLSVVAFFFSKRGVPPFLRGVGYLLIAVLNPLPIIVTGIGVFDLWADFRKPRITKPENKD